MYIRLQLIVGCFTHKNKNNIITNSILLIIVLKRSYQNGCYLDNKIDLLKIRNIIGFVPDEVGFYDNL